VGLIAPKSDLLAMFSVQKTDLGHFEYLLFSKPQLFEQRTDVEGSGRACPSTSQHIQHAGWNRNPSISLGRKGWMVAWEGGAVQ